VELYFYSPRTPQVFVQGQLHIFTLSSWFHIHIHIHIHKNFILLIDCLLLKVKILIAKSDYFYNRHLPIGLCIKYGPSCTGRRNPVFSLVRLSHENAF